MAIASERAFSLDAPNPGSEVRHLPKFMTASLATELGVLLTLSVLFPFMIHLLPAPEESKLGPRILPIFYAPLVAALLGRRQSALIVAVVAPWLNWLLTAHPTARFAWVVMVELVVFVIATRALLARTGPRWFLPLPAYVGCMIAATCVVALFPQLVGGAPAIPWALNTVAPALPGLAILILITVLLTRHYPTGGGGGPKAA